MLCQDDENFSLGTIDYFVPDPTALVALQYETSPILFPSTVRTAAAAISSTWNGTGNPFLIGFEFTPFFIGNNLNLSKYLSGRLIRVLLRTRFSAASIITPTGKMRTAAGARWMLHDDADLRSDSVFYKAMKEWEQVNMDDDDLLKNIINLRNAFRDSMWNKSVFEAAAAIIFDGENNSAGKSTVKLTGVNYFANLGWPLFAANGQIVFGATGHQELNGPDTGVLALRFSYGGALQRFFFDGRLFSRSENHPEYTAGPGLLIRITNGLWFETGYFFPLSNYSFTGSSAYLKFSYAAPEMTSLF